METVEQQVDQLVKSVETFAGRCKAGVRDILVDDEVRRVQSEMESRRFGRAGPVVTSADCARIRQRCTTTETATLDKEIGPQIEPLRAAIGQRVADARRLRLEAERVDAATNPNGFVNARLLDEFASERAEKFMARQTRTIRRGFWIATTRATGTTAAICTSSRWWRKPTGAPPSHQTDEAGYTVPDSRRRSGNARTPASRKHSRTRSRSWTAPSAPTG